MSLFIHLLFALLGLIIGQAITISRRNKLSNRSPYYFQLGFFIRDNWKKLLASMGLSAALVVVHHYSLSAFLDPVFSTPWIFFLLGLMPEQILEGFKQRVGWFQPEQVDGFDRLKIPPHHDN